MKVVLDTNVIVSSLLFRGPASAIHAFVLDGTILPLVSRPIIEEYQRVLGYRKFRLQAEDVEYLMQSEILPWSRMLDAPTGSAWIPEDPSDDHFVNLALVEENTLLISGDRHILDHRATLPCKVLTVAECLDILHKL
ncbi:MAG: putative toxin-antitoxin system toxin component, PIN family [Spirochaetia bacterium]|nr:putative toxin-antitoxin system toxin component, PIN family [Spirochaetia bacterium]